jgi:signal transduction histidine kinase/CheY-like chemotaxis protein
MNIFSTNWNENQIREQDWFNFERQFLIPLSLTGIFFSIISIFLNIFMGFNEVLIIIPFVSTFVFTIVYFMTKYGRHVAFAKWLFIFTTLFLVNLIWRYNYGSQGPWFFVIVLLYSYLIFMMSGRQLLLLSLILLANILVLYLFEYNHPHLLGDYPSDKIRLLDFYTAVFLSGASAYVLMSMAKKAYLTQYQKARTADKLKSAFLANMSHEIRTPLNAIVGFSNLLGDKDITTEERAEYVEIINNSSQSLLQLIDDILDVSLIEANQVKIEKADFQVNELLKKLEKTYHSVLKEKKIDSVQLKLQMPKDLFWIHSDAMRINQVMVNLMNNALKFTEAGSIVFGFEPEGEKLKFFVKDSGIGIAPDHLDHLFDRFYKIEDDNRKLYRGTGIGLYLCKKITEILGGSIHVESTFGKGSTFYFYIPAENLVIEPAGNRVKKEVPTLPSENKPQNGTVLIIEDDENSRFYFKKILESVNLHVLEAAGGKEGVTLFSDNPQISAVLLDIRLPGTSGFEVIKELKKIRPDVPVIAETAFAMVGDKEKCLAAGFDDYISKPVKREILLEKINKYR